MPPVRRRGHVVGGTAARATRGPRGGTEDHPTNDRPEAGRGYPRVKWALVTRSTHWGSVSPPRKPSEPNSSTMSPVGPQSVVAPGVGSAKMPPVPGSTRPAPACGRQQQQQSQPGAITSQATPGHEANLVPSTSLIAAHNNTYMLVLPNTTTTLSGQQQLSRLHSSPSIGPPPGHGAAPAANTTDAQAPAARVVLRLSADARTRSVATADCRQRVCPLRRPQVVTDTTPPDPVALDTGQLVRHAHVTKLRPLMPIRAQLRCQVPAPAPRVGSRLPGPHSSRLGPLLRQEARPLRGAPLLAANATDSPNHAPSKRRPYIRKQTPLTQAKALPSLSRPVTHTVGALGSTKPVEANGTRISSDDVGIKRGDVHLSNDAAYLACHKSNATTEVGTEDATIRVSDAHRDGAHGMYGRETQQQQQASTPPEECAEGGGDPPLPHLGREPTRLLVRDGMPLELLGERTCTQNLVREGGNTYILMNGGRCTQVCIPEEITDVISIEEVFIGKHRERQSLKENSKSLNDFIGAESLILNEIKHVGGSETPLGISGSEHLIDLPDCGNVDVSACGTGRGTCRSEESAANDCGIHAELSQQPSHNPITAYMMTPPSSPPTTPNPPAPCQSTQLLVALHPCQANIGSSLNGNDDFSIGQKMEITNVISCVNNNYEHLEGQCSTQNINILPNLCNAISADDPSEVFSESSSSSDTSEGSHSLALSREFLYDVIEEDDEEDTANSSNCASKTLNPNSISNSCNEKFDEMDTIKSENSFKDTLSLSESETISLLSGSGTLSSSNSTICQSDLDFSSSKMNTSLDTLSVLNCTDSGTNIDDRFSCEVSLIQDQEISMQHKQKSYDPVRNSLSSSYLTKGKNVTLTPIDLSESFRDSERLSLVLDTSIERLSYLERISLLSDTSVEFISDVESSVLILDTALQSDSEYLSDRSDSSSEFSDTNRLTIASTRSLDQLSDVGGSLVSSQHSTEYSSDEDTSTLSNDNSIISKNYLDRTSCTPTSSVESLSDLENSSVFLDTSIERLSFIDSVTLLSDNSNEFLSDNEEAILLLKPSKYETNKGKYVENQCKAMVSSDLPTKFIDKDINHLNTVLNNNNSYKVFHTAIDVNTVNNNYKLVGVNPNLTQNGIIHSKELGEENNLYKISNGQLKFGSPNVASKCISKMPSIRLNTSTLPPSAQKNSKTFTCKKGQRNSNSSNGKRGSTNIADSSSTPRSSCSSVTQLDDDNIPPTQPSSTTYANNPTQRNHVMRVSTRQTDNKKVLYNSRKSRQRSISASSGTSVSPTRQRHSSPIRNNLNRHSSPTRTNSPSHNNTLNDNEDPTDKNNTGHKQEWVSPGRFIYSPNITDITRSCKLNRKFSPNTNNNSNKRNNRNKQNTSPDRSSSPVRLHNSKTPFKTATVTPAPTNLTRNPLSLNRFGFGSTGKVKSGDSTDSVNSILSDAQPAISDSNTNLFEEEEKANNLSGTGGNRKNKNNSVEQIDNSAKQYEQTPKPLRRTLNTCSKSNIGNNLSRPSSLTSTPAHHNSENNRLTAHTKQLPKPQVATVKSVTPKTPQMNHSSRTTPVKSSYRSSTNSLNGTRTQPTEFGKSLRTTPRVSRDSKPSSKSIITEADSGLGSSSESDKIRGLEGGDSGDTDTVNTSEPNSEGQDTSEMWLKMNKTSGNKNSTVKRRSANLELLQNSNSPHSLQSKTNSQIKKVSPSSTKDKSDSPQMTYSMARQKIAPYNRSNRFGYGNYSTEKKTSPSTPNSAPGSTTKIPDSSSTVKKCIALLETTPSTSTKRTAPQSVLRRSNLKRPANRPTSLEKTPHLVMPVVQKTVELSKPVYRKLEYCENGRADSSDDIMSKSLEKISTNSDVIVGDMLIMDSVAVEKNLFNKGKEVNSELSNISSLDDIKLSPVRTVTVDSKTDSVSSHVSELGSVGSKEIGGFDCSYLSSSRDLCLRNNDDSSQMDNKLSPLTPEDSVNKIETPQSESSFEILESVSESVDSSADYTRYSTDTREDTTSVSLSIADQSISKESRESTIIEVKNDFSDISSNNSAPMLTSIESMGASVTLMSNSIVTNTEPVESVVTLIKSMDAPMTIEEPNESVNESCDRSSTSAESIMDRSMTSIESIESQISKASSVLIKDTFNASMTVAPPSPPRIIRPPVPEKPKLRNSPKRDSPQRDSPHTQVVRLNENINENFRNSDQIQQNSKRLISNTMEPVVQYDELNNVEMMNTANTNRNRSTSELISSLEKQIIKSSPISDAKESNLSSSEVVDRNILIKSKETINVQKHSSPETVNMSDSTTVKCMTDSIGSKAMSESITGKSMSDSFPGKSMSDSFSGRSMTDSYNSGKCTPNTARGQSADMDQDFLIDDEIADQPELMFYGGGGSSLTSSFFGDENLFDDLGSPSPALSHAPTKPEDILRHPALEKLQNLENRSRTNSVCTNSSMGADDLMLDYDIDEGPKQTSGYDEEVLSPDASEIFHEWTAMMAEVSPLGQSVNIPALERCVSRESNGGGGSSTASVNGSSGGSRSGSRARLTSTGSSSDITQGENARTRTILRPPRQGGLAESDLSVDRTAYHYMCQDVTAIKTMLLRLRRVLHNADTINPFHANIKNAMYLSLGSDSSGNVTPTGDREPALNQVAQENIDLKRQVVLLQQQLDDRDRTIRLLQQQLQQQHQQQQQATVNCQTVATSPTASGDGSRGSERTNAATQTERSFRPMAASGSSSLSRTTSIDDGLGPTVSSECEGRGRSISAPNSHQRVTRRAISQPPALLVTRDNSNAS